jgi:transposase-like protein
VVKLCLLGQTDAELADSFGVSESTLNLWKKTHEDFSESIKKGKSPADADVAKSLYDKALAGDVTAQIFWLKNRKSSAWRDKRETEHSGSVTLESLVSGDTD